MSRWIETDYGYIMPCPFCGAHSKHGWRRKTYHDHVAYFDSEAVNRPIVIYCIHCHGSISGYDLKDAVARWNDRRRYDKRK